MGFKDWETPPEFFAKLHTQYQFTLDAAAGHENALLPRYCAIEGTFDNRYIPVRQISELDGLTFPWKGERVFCNPPYDRTLEQWVAKAAECEADAAVLLLPPSVDTKWFHKYITRSDCYYRFLEGRLRFWRDGKPSKAPRAGNLLAMWFR